MSQPEVEGGQLPHGHKLISQWRNFTRWISVHINPRRPLTQRKFTFIVSTPTNSPSINSPHSGSSSPTKPSNDALDAYPHVTTSKEAASSSLADPHPFVTPSILTSLYRTGGSAGARIVESIDPTVKGVLQAAAESSVSMASLLESATAGTSHASLTTSEEDVRDVSGLVQRGSLTYPGTYSDVYQGKCGAQLVAIKVIKSLPSEPLYAVRRRMRREVRTSSRFDHPNVLAVYGVIDAEWCPLGGIVTVWCANGDASKYIHREDVTVQARLQMVCGVTAGLEYIHSLSVVHGDLKPGNILIDDLGNPLICDFGLVCILDTEQPDWVADNTTTAHCGTIRYLSYELAKDPPDSRTMASDIHALGCVTYESLYLKGPYPTRRGINAGPYIFGDIRNGLSPAPRPSFPLPASIFNLWCLFDWCWDKDPRQRPTITAFSRFLQSFAESSLQLDLQTY